MNKILFSHDYEKLPDNWEGDYATLVAVEIYTYKELQTMGRLLEYDTKFRGEEGSYELDKNENYLLLNFIHHLTGKPFTTVRRRTPEKAKYYILNIGTVFEMVKTKEVNK